MCGLPLVTQWLLQTTLWGSKSNQNQSQNIEWLIGVLIGQSSIVANCSANNIFVQMNIRHLVVAPKMLPYMCVPQNNEFVCQLARPFHFLSPYHHSYLPVNRDCFPTVKSSFCSLNPVYTRMFSDFCYFAMSCIHPSCPISKAKLTIAESLRMDWYFAVYFGLRLMHLLCSMILLWKSH